MSAESTRELSLFERLKKLSVNYKFKGFAHYLDLAEDIPPLKLSFSTGPKCNLSCNHCYDNCGPDREGQLDLTIVKKVMDTARKMPFVTYIFSDGEPFLDKSVMLTSLRELNGKSTDIVTNAYFADTYESAFNVLTEMKNYGWNPYATSWSLGFDNASVLASSFDAYRPDFLFERILNLIEAYYSVFDDSSLLDRLKPFSILYTSENGSTDYNSDDFFKRSILLPLSKRFNSDVCFEPEDGSNFLNYVIDDNRIVKIRTQKVSNVGRKKSDSGSYEPTLEDFNVDPYYTVTVDHKGNLIYEGGELKAPGFLVGNIFNESLPELLEKMKSDSLIQIHRLFGLYGVTDTAKDYGIIHNTTGTDECSYSRKLFSNLDFCNEFREKVDYKTFKKDLLEYNSK